MEPNQYLFFLRQFIFWLIIAISLVLCFIVWVFLAQHPPVKKKEKDHMAMTNEELDSFFNAIDWDCEANRN
jgi:hypothetical protein